MELFNEQTAEFKKESIEFVDKLCKLKKNLQYLIANLRDSSKDKKISMDKNFDYFVTEVSEVSAIMRLR